MDQHHARCCHRTNQLAVWLLMLSVLVSAANRLQLSVIDIDIQLWHVQSLND
jgi:hypothetical protein